jgi:hypothetical protein
MDRTLIDCYWNCALSLLVWVAGVSGKLLKQFSALLNSWFHPCSQKKLKVLRQCKNALYSQNVCSLINIRFTVKKNLWINDRSPSYVPYVALLLPDGTCVPLTPFFPLFLHFWSRSLTLTLSAEWTVKKLVPCLSFKIPYLWRPAGNGRS